MIGADGATSHVAGSAGLVEDARVLWGFAVRCYLDQAVELPAIILWEPTPWRAFPGYGWIFPGPDGRGQRRARRGHPGRPPGRGGGGAGAPGLSRASGRAGPARPSRPTGPGPGRLGGWLKMGMVGTMPAAGRVLLVGDAAGLVNPLQGEGIAQAMTSGRAAAEAILDVAGRGGARLPPRPGPEPPPLPADHRSGPCGTGGPTACRGGGGTGAHRPGGGPALAGGWGIFWNELLEGAAPGRARAVAGAATRLGGAVTARTRVSGWFDTVYGHRP